MAPKAKCATIADTETVRSDPLGESLRRAVDGAWWDRQGGDDDAGRQAAERTERGSGCDSGNEAVRQRNEHPRPPRDQDQQRHHDDAAGDDPRRHLVDRVRETEKPTDSVDFISGSPVPHQPRGSCIIPYARPG